MNEKIKKKINCMNYNKLEKLANWLTNRYWKKRMPEIAYYIVVRYYHLEEAKAGLL